jgi:Lon protease-like protein
MTGSVGGSVGGQVLPMFPLGSVLFPGMPLQLQIFEERYVRMVEQCLASGSGFGVVLIERGSEVGGGDVRSDFGTLAVIEDSQKFADGTWSLVAVGTRRLTIVEWLEDAPYPRAVVSGWDENIPTFDASLLVQGCAEQLAAYLRRVTPAGSHLEIDFSRLSDDPSEAIWQLCSISPIGPLDRQRLLICADLGARLEVLSNLLTEQHELLDLGGRSSGEFD